MKFSSLIKKLANMSDDEIEEYLADLQNRGGYEKIVFDGKYEKMFELDPDDGSITWTCPEHGDCEADFMDLFMRGGWMLKNFEDHGCGFEE